MKSTPHRLPALRAIAIAKPVTPAPEPIRFLRTHRNQLLQPHRFAAILVAYLRGQAELLAAVARDTHDERWRECARELDAVAERVRRLA